MASAIKGGKARLDQIKMQQAGKPDSLGSVDTVQAAGSPRGASKSVKKKPKAASKP